MSDKACIVQLEAENEALKNALPSFATAAC